MAVQVSADTVYEPDAQVRFGPPLPDDDVKILDPVVVEVLSPSTHAYDAGAKLGGSLRMPSVRHYLLLDTKNRIVIHHERSANGDIATRIAHEGSVRLGPPGIALDVAGLFRGAEGEGER